MPTNNKILHTQLIVPPSLCVSLHSVPVCVGARLRTQLHLQHRGVLPRQVQTGHAEPGPGPVVFLGGHSGVSHSHTDGGWGWAALWKEPFRGANTSIVPFGSVPLMCCLTLCHYCHWSQEQELSKWDEEVGASREQRRS